MSSFCTAKATHIFFSKNFQHICVSLDVNFNESLTNNVVSFEQLGPGFQQTFFSFFFFQKIGFDTSCKLSPINLLPGEFALPTVVKVMKEYLMIILG